MSIQNNHTERFNDKETVVEYVKGGRFTTAYCLKTTLFLHQLGNPVTR